MDAIYQSLVAVNPVTLIAQICNLFLQMFVVKKFFLSKVCFLSKSRNKFSGFDLVHSFTAFSYAILA